MSRSLSTAGSPLPPRLRGVRALRECAPGADVDVVRCGHERALPGAQRTA